MSSAIVPTGGVGERVGDRQSTTGEVGRAFRTSGKRVDQLPAPRWELLRAIGALTAIPPPASLPISRALGLGQWTAAEHTRVFVLELPPYASIHLGADGMLGGEGADRVAGIWRALGLQPPRGADHLASLFGLYAELGHAGDTCNTEIARRRLEHSRRTLLSEHLSSWLPGYLAAVAADPAAADWAHLAHRSLCFETEQSLRPMLLPAALREAPPPIEGTIGCGDLLDAVSTPLRVGFVLSYSDLTSAGRDIGVGVRRGERRYALRAMLEQDPVATVAWLAGHARRWADVHRTSGLGDAAAAWWERRAEITASVLESFSVAH